MIPSITLMGALFVRAVSALSGFIISFLLLKIYGEAEVGKYYLILNFVVVLSAICRFGADYTLVEKWASKKEVVFADYFGFLVPPFFVVSIILAVFFFLGSTISGVYFKETLSSVDVFLLILSVLFFSIFQLASFSFQAKNQNIRFQIYNFTLFNLFIIFSCIYGFVSGNDVSLIEAVCLSAFFVAVTSNIDLFKIFFSHQKQSFKLPDMNLEWVFSAHRVWSTVLVFSSISTGYLVPLYLSFYLSVEKFGAFIFIFKLVWMVSNVLFVTNSLVAPKVSVFYQKNDFNSIFRLYIQAIAINVVAGGLFLVIVLVYFEQFWRQFIGPIEYLNENTTVLKCLIVAQIVNLVTGPVGLVLAYSGRKALNVAINVFALSLFLLAVPILVNIYGEVGAALSVMIFVIVSNLACFVVFLRCCFCRQ